MSLPTIFLQKHDFDHFDLILFKRPSCEISFSDFVYLLLNRIAYIFFKLRPYVSSFGKVLWLNTSFLILQYGVTKCLFQQFFCRNTILIILTSFSLNAPRVKFHFPTLCTFCWIASHIFFLNCGLKCPLLEKSYGWTLALLVFRQ